MSVWGSQFGGVGSAYETNGHLFYKGTQNHCTPCCIVASDPEPVWSPVCETSATFDKFLTS